MRVGVITLIKGSLVTGISLWLTGASIVAVARGQVVSVFRGPVSALNVAGDRLLIGQGSVLVEANVTADGVQPTAAVDLRRHDIRAITTSLDMTFVLSEDGLTTLDTQHHVLGFVAGGGQHLVVDSERVYIAALGAGVRMLKFDVLGRLTPLYTMPTTGPAFDLALAPSVNHTLWVAEGDSGVRLYDMSIALMPRVLRWFRDVVPATVVRSSNDRLYIGHDNRLTLLDTSNMKAPRVISNIALDGDESRVGDFVIQGSRAYVGRVNTAGADVLQLDISTGETTTGNAANVASFAVSFGLNGAGEQLALYKDDLFIGSGRLGLQRVRFENNQPVLLMPLEAVSAARTCLLTPPTNPQPPNLSSIQSGPVLLSWQLACTPSAIQVRIDDVPVAPINGSSYAFTPRSGITTWQVTALDSSGNRFDGPRWTFETVTDGWLATPAPIAQRSVLYAPSVMFFDLRSPGVLTVMICSALGVGLSIAMVVAWAIGALAMRRAGTAHGK